MSTITKIRRMLKSNPPVVTVPRKNQGVDRAMSKEDTLAFIRRCWQGYRHSEYNMPKWIIFCKKCLAKKIQVRIYDASSTVSKYIYLYKEGYKVLKIRFSNHKPNRTQQRMEDCDYYVGISHNKKWSTAEQVLERVFNFYDIN